MDADGRRPSGRHPDHRTDQIGWYVPAVPHPDGDAYWGYSSVTDDGLAWWRALPSLPVAQSVA
jgi:hypothetical protein